MLQEEHATEYSYDASLDVVRLRTGRVESGATLRRKNSDANLLLDAQNFLVGVDFGGEGPSRRVLMCGPHEAVKAQRPGRIEVAEDLVGNIAEVVVRSAKALVRGDEKNPYL